MKTALFLVVAWLVSGAVLVAAGDPEDDGNGAPPVVEEEPALRLTLATVLDGTLRSNPAMRAAEWKVRRANEVLARARSERYLSRFELNSTGGWLPGSGESYFEDMGVFLKSELSLVQPIYTFGKLSSAIRLAEFGLDLERLKRVQAREQLLLKTLEFYWMLAAAIKTETMALEIERRYNRLLEKIEERLENPDSDTDDTDRLEAETARFRIQGLVQKAVSDRALLGNALLALAGFPETNRIRLGDEEAPPAVFPETNVAALFRISTARHVELQGLEVTLHTLRERVNLNEKSYYPEIFIGGGARYNMASNRPDSDDYNSRGVAAFLGLRWRLDFWRAGNDVERSELDYRVFLEEAALARERHRLELEKTFIEAARGWRMLCEARDAFAAAKTWLRLSLENYDLGLFEFGKVLKAYNAYYEFRGAEIQEEYKYHMALARLAYYLGSVELCQEWIKNEKVIVK